MHNSKFGSNSKWFAICKRFENKKAFLFFPNYPGPKPISPLK
jgi:hypothetical protein